MNDNIVIEFTKDEINYLKGALSGLIQIEKAIPAKLKTKNTTFLYSVYEKIDKVVV